MYCQFEKTLDVQGKGIIPLKRKRHFELILTFVSQAQLFSIPIKQIFYSAILSMSYRSASETF